MQLAAALDRSMKLTELKNILSQHSQLNIGFRMPDERLLPAHAHVTEVARIDKRFVDCGGTFRSDSFCRLQTWMADDFDHRLRADKLLRILDKAASFLGTDEIEVDVEYELGVITHSPVVSATISSDTILLKLEERRTACLAPEKCLPPAEFRKFKPIATFSSQEI